MCYGAERRQRIVVSVTNGNEKIWNKYGKKLRQSIDIFFENPLLEYTCVYMNFSPSLICKTKISCGYFLLRVHIPIPERMIVL